MVVLGIAMADSVRLLGPDLPTHLTGVNVELEELSVDSKNDLSE
jgi:hypothetical protein